MRSHTNLYVNRICRWSRPIFIFHRCNIPVILMGETGCGKTRLIKYMCELLSLNSPDSTTLVIMKVILLIFANGMLI